MDMLQYRGAPLPGDRRRLGIAGRLPRRHRMPRRPSGRRIRACDAAPRAFPPRTPARWRWANPRTPAWRRSSQPHRQSRGRCPPRAWSYPRPSGRGRTPRRGAARADPTRPRRRSSRRGPRRRRTVARRRVTGSPAGAFSLQGTTCRRFRDGESSTFSHLAVNERRSHTSRRASEDASTRYFSRAWSQSSRPTTSTTTRRPACGRCRRRR